MDSEFTRMSDTEGLTTRQTEIAQRLTERGFVSTTELAALLSVSDMTIRRDTRELARRGIVQLVHGGGVLPHGTIHTAGFAQRASEDAAGKEKIAAACQSLISSREALLIDAGTTSYEVAHKLPETFRGTIITHSAPVIQLALRLGLARTICLGGELVLDSQAFIGEMTVSSVKGLRAQSAIIGVAGITARGLYIERDLELPTKRAIMDAADRVILVATHNKMDNSALVYLSGFDAVDILVTDAAPPAGIARAAIKAGVEIIVAGENS